MYTSDLRLISVFRLLHQNSINYLFVLEGGLGCHLDRHENIGKGHIGIEGFRRIMTEHRFDGIPMILETPLGDYAAEIQTLNKLT